MKARYVIAVVALLGLLIGSASAYTYTVYREDIDRILFHSYDTIIPTDDPRRNSLPGIEKCNGGFSPNPCGDVHTVPEPGIVFIFIWGLILLIYIFNNRNRK